MKKYKPNIKYIIFFIYFFLCLVFFFTTSRGDTFVNYGFSYAIRLGQIPYKEFNMIITPLSPFIYSISLILSKSIIFYYLFQSLLLTITTYFLFKLLDKKAWIFLLLWIVPYPVAICSTLFPGYNFLCFLLLIILFYLEENKKSNYLIGIILGLLFCTKQTIGIALFIPTIYYLFKDRKKIIERFIGYITPIFILFIYLLLTNTFTTFIDLCFLGLLDFSNSNNQFDIFYLVLFIFSIIYLIRNVIKNNNIISYYSLLFIVIALPIIDYYHVSILLLIVIYNILKNSKFKLDSKYIKYIIIGIISLTSIWQIIQINFFSNFSDKNKVIITNYNNFPLLVLSTKYNNKVKELNNYTNKLDKEVIYLMRGSENYFYKIINNKKITYFDLPNYGNYGYKGTKRIINKLDNIHNKYIIIDINLLKDHNKSQQYIKELAIKVNKECKKKKVIGYYYIYYKE
ncbi:MAG: hypothetical protein IKG58_02600 [Bacilli bacterium]|nr:hypothetical protein [Bacilli bacterium]